LSGIEPDGAASIEKTNAAMGITKAFLPATTQPIEHVGGDAAEHPAIEAVRAAHAGFRETGYKGSEEPTN
jgi:hypothetical protein